MSYPRSCLSTGRAVLVLLLYSCAAAAEDVPAVHLSGILSPQVKQSVHHSVEDVQLDGGFYEFRMTSEFGTYGVRSLALLRTRVDEVITVAQAINQFSRGGGDGTAEEHGQLSIRADSAIDILTRPVESASDLAGQLAANVNETLTGSPVVIEQARERALNTAESMDPVTAMHKRNVAAQWGLDVYSSNPAVQGFLNTVARARSGGQISAGAPSFFVSSRQRVTVADPAIDATVAALIKNKSPEQLADDNAQMLSGMQVRGKLGDAFIEQPYMSPTYRTRIIHYLAALEGVLDRSSFLEAALEARSEHMVLAFERAVMMLLHFHRNHGVLRKLYAGAEMLQAITADNRIVYIAPMDHVYWSERTESIINGLQSRASEAGFASWEIAVAGEVTGTAMRALQDRGFVVYPNYVEGGAVRPQAAPPE